MTFISFSIQVFSLILTKNFITSVLFLNFKKENFMKLFLAFVFSPIVALAHGDLERITCTPSQDGLKISLKKGKAKDIYNLEYQKSLKGKSKTQNVTLAFQDEIENKKGKTPTIYDNITFKEKDAPKIKFRVLEDHSKEERPAQAFFADATLNCTAHF